MGNTQEKEQETIESYEYVTFPAEFARYKWYMPLLVGFAFMAIYLFFVGVVFMLSAVISGDPNAYLDMAVDVYQRLGTLDAYDAAGTMMTIGQVAVMLPALYIACRIVHYRPFSSYSSSRGGWNWTFFLRGLLLALPGIAALAVYTLLRYGKTGENHFTVAGVILLTLLVPIQSVAEEYIYRGALMQTAGAWSKQVWVGIAAQLLLFIMMHPYNGYGTVAVLVMGLVCGMMTWYTRGLEAASAFHILYNLAVYYLAGFGFGTLEYNAGLEEMFWMVGVSLLMAALVFIFNWYFGWFAGGVKRDDVADFNEKLISGKIRKRKR